MSELETKYCRASQIATAAMGKTKRWGETAINNAEEDPLAWWVLTEIIANQATEHRRK